MQASRKGQFRFLKLKGEFRGGAWPSHSLPGSVAPWTPNCLGAANADHGEKELGALGHTPRATGRAKTSPAPSRERSGNGLDLFDKDTGLWYSIRT
jgi:hypothetical protein